MNFPPALQAENCNNQNEKIHQLITNADWTDEVLQFCATGGFPEEVIPSHITIDDSDEGYILISFRIYYNTPVITTCGAKDITNREVAYALLRVNKKDGADWSVKTGNVGGE